MKPAKQDITERLNQEGFAVLPHVLRDEEVKRLVTAVNESQNSTSLLRDGETYGMRDLLRSVSDVRSLAGSASLMEWVEPVLGSNPFAVRGLWFDKTEGANWGVPWHQDTTIAVRERLETPGFGPWTLKAGIHHVRPPASILAGMVTLRVHLDDCDEENGPLLVVPGSQVRGRLDAAGMARLLGREQAVPCLVKRGGIVLIRPLILHASSAATKPRHRRVIHLEYAAHPLPGGLDWFERVGRNER